MRKTDSSAFPIAQNRFHDKVELFASFAIKYPLLQGRGQIKYLEG